MFVFVHIPPIWSVLLTYSLKINGLLFDPPCIWVYDLQRQKNDETDRKVEKIAIAGTSRKILTALNTTQM